MFSFIRSTFVRQIHVSIKTSNTQHCNSVTLPHPVFPYEDCSILMHRAF